MLAASTRLGPYQVIARLGVGGMGEVYRARDTRLGRDVAIKVLPESFAHDADRRARFEREARAVAALTHPNILSIHDYGTEGEVTYAVMELLEGETLRDRLKKGPLSWREALDTGAAIADGLASAHAKGVIHRDLKPENLFLTCDGRVKILDFGLARVEPTPNVQEETGPYVPAQTNPGAVMGTVGYMSPEQVRGQPADARSDLFSLGCVLYEMVAGQRAFKRETSAETMTAILHDEPPDLASAQPIPEEMTRLIRQCLAKSVNQRLHSARDLALALRATASQPAAPSSAIRRGVEALAVLPFENVGGDPKTEYLSDGVADHLIISLLQVRREGLKVRPFSSVLRYKRQRADAPTIGKELNVQVLVTGTLHQVGDDLWISVAIVEAREDNQIWGKRYQSRLNGILNVQDQIARDVAANLRLRLTGEEEKRLTKRGTEDPEAYLLYREARYHFNKFTEAGLDTSIDYCRRALKKDPNYALAYCGLGQCHFVLGAIHRGFRDNYAESRTAYDRALVLDGNLAEAHTGLASLYLMHDWNWPAAKRELDRAIAIDPDLPVAWELYGFYHAVHGQLTDALASARRSPELEPLAAPGRGILTMCYNWIGQYDQAAAEARKIVELEPTFPFSYCELAIAQVHQGKHAEAIAELHTAIGRGHTHPRVRGMLGYAYAKAGRAADARRVIEELKGQAQNHLFFAHPIARIHAALGERDQAFAWLQRACDERDSSVIWMKVDPPLENLRSDPRLGRILRDMGLPTENDSDTARSALSLPSPTAHRPRRRVGWLLAALVLAALIGTAVYFSTRGHKDTDAPKTAEEAKAIEVVAVLPFENIGGDPKTESLSEGIPETVIHGLSRLRLRDLKVKSLLAVARYKGRKPDLKEVRRELAVGAVVTGTLRQHGDRLIINVSLIDVRDGNEIWGDKYQEKLDDILILQDKISKSIAANLRLHLTGEEEQRLTQRGTDNPEAYQLYLKGRHAWNKRTREGLEQAIDYFKRAINADPTYALAQAGLADVYVVFPFNTDARPSEYSALAKAAAREALKLDHQLAEAYAALAWVTAIYDWKWSEGEDLFNHAIKLNPNYATAHQRFGGFLLFMGRFDEAREQHRLGRDLDPLSLINRAIAGRGDFFAGRYEAAIEQYRIVLERDPDFGVARIFLGQALIESEKYEQALLELKEVKQSAHLEPLSLMGRAYALMGRRAEAMKVIEELKTLNRYVPPCRVALVCASLGENKQALDWLEKAYDERDRLLCYLKVEPAYKELRREPRFKDLLRRMGLADKAVEKDHGIHSVAVLPFQNVGGDPKTEFLSDGVADQIINSLSQVGRQDLKVRPFTSVARYKGKEIDVPTFGRELNVQMIVTGRLQQAGDDLAIHVAVVDVKQEAQLWGKTYPGKREKILDLQDEIARDVAANLRLQLTGEEEKRLTKRYTDDPETYFLYREGMYHSNKLRPEEVQRGKEYFEQALEKDPTYAPALMGLAGANIRLGNIHLRPRQTYPEAEKLLSRALAIDDTLADAHALLAMVYMTYDWDWPAAEREAKRAVALGSYLPVHGYWLAAHGRLPEALAALQRCQELDPVAAPRRSDLAMCYILMGQPDQAIAEAQKAIELDMQFLPAYGELGLAYAQKKEHGEALKKLLKSQDSGRDSPRLKGLLGYIYAKAEQPEEARGILEELKALAAKDRFACAFGIARIHAALAEKDQAIAWLRKACDERDMLVLWVKVDPTLDNLRSESPFAQVLKDMGLPP